METMEVESAYLNIKSNNGVLSTQTFKRSDLCLQAVLLTLPLSLGLTTPFALSLTSGV